RMMDEWVAEPPLTGAVDRDDERRLGQALVDHSVDRIADDLLDEPLAKAHADNGGDPEDLAGVLAERINARAEQRPDGHRHACPLAAPLEVQAAVDRRSVVEDHPHRFGDERRIAGSPRMEAPFI